MADFETKFVGVVEANFVTTKLIGGLTPVPLGIYATPKVCYLPMSKSMMAIQCLWVTQLPQRFKVKDLEVTNVLHV